MTTTTSTRPQFEPSTGYLGAEVSGVDLSTELDDETVAEIKAGLLRHRVLFFRNQDITFDQHIRFGEYFGHVNPAHPIIPSIDGYPQIFANDNRERRHQERSLTQEYDDGNRFHSDVAFVQNPPIITILHGVIIPSHGGDTIFSNTVAAYEELSEPIRRLADGLRAVFHNRSHNNARGGVLEENKSVFESEDYATIHPVVRVHPETGEKAIYVNPGLTSHLLDLSKDEADTIINLLYRQITKLNYTVRHRWTPGDVVIWDNRAVVHIAPTDMRKVDEDRLLHRVLIRGDVPVGPDGFRSEIIRGVPFV